METFDTAVIGAGPGGYVAAIRAAQLGQKTCLVEARDLGGTCLNVGCIPSKALLESSELYSVARNKFAEHGIQAEPVGLDLKQMMKRKTKIVGELVGGLKMLMKKNKITVYNGRGRLKSASEVVVEPVDGGSGKAETFSAKSIVLATGSAPIELPFLLFDGTHVVSSTEALSFDRVPEHLVVVGAGAIGLEMGSVWARLGAKVTVLERLPRIVPAADAEMAKALQKSLAKQGLNFELGCEVKGADVDRGQVKLHYTDTKGEAQELICDRVLVAVGRRPVSNDLGLEEVGVTIERGRVVVDEHFRTSVNSIYAIGDVVRGPMLAHKAEDEGVAVAEIIAGKPGHVNYHAIPNVVYTWPELAEVGLSEEAAKEAGHKVKVGRYRFAANGRAKTLGDTEGLVKLIAEAETDQLLGAHIVGPRGSDMIAELVIAMEFSASAEDVARTTHAHPTLAEIVKEAALAVDARPIHG